MLTLVDEFDNLTEVWQRTIHLDERPRVGASIVVRGLGCATTVENVQDAEDGGQQVVWLRAVRAGAHVTVGEQAARASVLAKHGWIRV